jgi:hypothetical protein
MSKTSMTAIALGAFGAALLASAAPLNATTIGSAEVSNVDQAGLFCNEYYGRCWRTRVPRYVPLLLRPQLLPRPRLQPSR